ncbi:MAG: ribonuclease III [Bacteroidetes bacterium QH_2_63_10]|nr:MAG: ribonuclease III [Bacteroidetes bacterium QH_2_63_10]
MSDPPLPPDARVSRRTVEQLVGRPVDDLSLYRQALTHRSLLRVHPEHALQSNERLEFLGDALLDLLIGEVLFDRFPDKAEGALTRLRARLVSERPLATYARHMDLGAHLLMSENAVQGGGRDNPSILADAFEALVGAVYRDQGHEGAHAFVHEQVLDPFDLMDVAARDENYKSQLLEYMQARARPQPTYRVVQEEGPSHDKTFTVEVRVGETAYEQGTAGSKQAAEQQAARQTLERLTEVRERI